MGEQFYLKWNNHQNTLIGVFDKLLGTEKYADCILAAEGRVLKAHKVVLSACSPYLEYLLNQQGTDKHPILIFNDIKFSELKAMLDYMYKGEVNVLQEQFNSFLKAAKSLQVKGLTDQGGGSSSSDGGEDAKSDEQPKRRPEVKGPRESSSSPPPQRKKRKRRTSQESFEEPQSSSDPTPAPKTKVDTERVNSSVSLPQPPVAHTPAQPVFQAKTEPPELVLQPKTEFIDHLNDDQPVEDLTLDDDDEEDLGYMANPSTSIGENSQDYNSSWQMGDQGGADSFLAAQEAMGNQNNSQVAGQKKISGMEKFFDAEEMVYKCDRCEKWYTKPQVLLRHRRFECSGIPRSICDFCQFETDNKKNLLHHMKRHHFPSFLKKAPEKI